MPDAVALSPDGRELQRLLADLRSPSRRVFLGIVGAPGSGKSTLAAVVARGLGEAAAQVPMDGFHLADRELDRLGLRSRKGAPETFDAWGYGDLLARLRARPSYVVYAPAFERDLEQPLASALPVPASVDVVVTEGNYLLLDRPEWRHVRAQLDRVWFVATAEQVRGERLVARHVRFGKSRSEAQEWVRRVDEPNARLVDACRDRADLRIDLTGWTSGLG